MKAKVLEWLEKSGFPLEMRAASAFREVGFDVRQSSTYSDPETGTGREIDIVASDPDIIGVIQISCIIECKATQKPWVILLSDDAYANFNRLHSFAVMSPSAFSALAGSWGRFQHLKPHMARPNHGGYSLRQAFSGDSDPAYAAAVSVLKACKDFSNASPKLPAANVAFPIIVVSAPLFECTLQADGSLALVEVDSSSFLFLAHIPEATGASIRVVRESALPAFARDMKLACDAVRKELAPEEIRVLAKLGKISSGIAEER